MSSSFGEKLGEEQRREIASGNESGGKSIGRRYSRTREGKRQE